MSTISEIPSEGSPQASSMSTATKVRLAAFGVTAVALAALNLALTPPEVLLAAFTGWGAFGIHQIHDQVISSLLWIVLLIPLAVLLYHPTKRVNTVLAPVALALPVAVMAYVAGSPLFTGFAISSVLAVALIALHPAGRSLLRLDRVESIDRRLAALYAVAAVPLVVYGALELLKQFGPVDEHALFVHYGAMTIAAGFIVLMGALAVVRQRDWQYAAWGAGLVAAFMGLVSLVYPTIESSLGVLGGALLIVWAVAFVASVTYSRRRVGGAATPVDESIEEPPAQPV